MEPLEIMESEVEQLGRKYTHWTAIQMTETSERVIAETSLLYSPQRHDFDKGPIAKVLYVFATLWGGTVKTQDDQYHDAESKYQYKREADHRRLVASLKQAGWEIDESEDVNLATTMKRTQNDIRADEKPISREGVTAMNPEGESKKLEVESQARGEKNEVPDSESKGGPDSEAAENDNPGTTWMIITQGLSLLLLLPYLGLCTFSSMVGFPDVMFEEGLNASSITFTIMLLYPAAFLVCALFAWYFHHNRRYGLSALLSGMPLVWACISVLFWDIASG